MAASAQPPSAVRSEDENTNTDHDFMGWYLVLDADDVHEDDPQIDWRTQEQEDIVSDTSSIEDEESVSSDDADPVQFLAFDYEIPEALMYMQLYTR